MIEIEDLSKTYRMGDVDVHALNGVSLKIAQGEFVAIMGPSGSGKSTLMHILGLLDAPDAGHYRLDGREVRELSEDQRARLRSRSVGFVFQQFNLIPRVSARENVALPLIYAGRKAGVTPESVLNRVGLGDRMRHAPNELSVGQQQRVAIARALVNDPDILMADEPTGNLDSASSGEIMALLRELHASGLTVILVTHDPDVAKNADRIITVRDGKVVDDTGMKRAGAQTAPHPQRLRKAEEAETSDLLRTRFVEFASMFRQAGRALTANKTRTALSMLGVLIGVAAVIAVMALGAGARQAVEDRISSMGANLLVLLPQRQQSRGVALGAGAVSRLTLDDAAAIQVEVSGVEHTSPTIRGGVQVTYESANWRTTATGVQPIYAAIHSMTPKIGRFFTPLEVDDRARVAVIGTTVSKQLFGADSNPVGNTIRINRTRFEVIGLLPEKGSNPFMDENDQIMVPVTTAMRRLFGRDYVDTIEMQTVSADDLDYVEVAAEDLVKRRHRVTSKESVFQVRNMADIQSTIQATSQTISVLLLSIGAVSLLVGGIGIMNIMLVSVTERTREIGIRKAVGARRADIMVQFLVESVVVSLLGGLLGLALGMGASYTMGQVAGWAVVVTPRTVLVAMGFSVVVGVVFGLWPAQKASALEPIAALRYE
jgi:macrolide transport system ATP-binding/permease protein